MDDETQALPPIPMDWKKMFFEQTFSLLKAREKITILQGSNPQVFLTDKQRAALAYVLEAAESVRARGIKDLDIVRDLLDSTESRVYARMRNPTNNYLFKRMADYFGIVQGEDTVSSALDKIENKDKDRIMEDPRVKFYKSKPSTNFVERFMDALELMCQARPPLEFIQQWTDDVQVNGADQLQEWVLNNQWMDWATGIGTIEAAIVMADNPREDQEHVGFYRSGPAVESQDQDDTADSNGESVENQGTDPRVLLLACSLNYVIGYLSNDLIVKEHVSNLMELEHYLKTGELNG